MTQVEMIEALKSVLKTELGVTDVQMESPDWTRFTMSGLECQGGVHSNDFRLSAFLCNIDPGAEMGPIWAAIETANKEIGAPLARLEEEDCYLQIKTAAPFDQVSPAKLAELLQAIVALSKHEKTKALKNAVYWLP